VPGLLAVALVGTLFWYTRSSRVPAEPPAGTPLETAAPTPTQPVQHAPERREPERAREGADPQPSQAQGQDVSVTPTHPEPTSPDPQGGDFTLAEATAGMPAGTRLVAEIETTLGTFTCDLWPDRAPKTVANFVGLARGTRDFWDPVAGRWTRRPYYDGTVFHRVIPDFMIQGGDILRSGRGGPGYEFRDENVANHDEPGLLCMANHGPNTNGSQFFILEDPKPHLNGSYSVFGRCSPVSLVERIARVPRNPRDMPLTPVYIQHVRIHR
jgi:peptidyl-prolyl cis-trans isomerase A (cyclophilin A)